MAHPRQNYPLDRQNRQKIPIFSTLTVRFTYACSANCKRIDNTSTALFNFRLT
jgi:hypothetical protein